MSSSTHFDATTFAVPEPPCISQTVIQVPIHVPKPHDETPQEPSTNATSSDEEVPSHSIITLDMKVRVNALETSAPFALENHSALYDQSTNSVFLFGGFDRIARKYGDTKSWKLNLDTNQMFCAENDKLLGSYCIECGVSVVAGSANVTFIGGVDNPAKSKAKKTVKLDDHQVQSENFKVYEWDIATGATSDAWELIEQKDKVSTEGEPAEMTPAQAKIPDAPALTKYARNSIPEFQHISSPSFKPVELHSTYESLYHLRGQTCHYDSNRRRFVGFGGISIKLESLQGKANSVITHSTRQNYSAYVFYIDEDTHSFTRIHPKGLIPQYVPEPRAFPSSVLYANRWLFVYGGYTCNNTKDHNPFTELFIHVFDTKYNLWIAPLEIPKEANSLGTQTLCLVNDYLVLVGGVYSKNVLTMYHLATGEWESAAVSCFGGAEDAAKKLTVAHHTCTVLPNNHLLIIGQSSGHPIIVRAECDRLVESKFTGSYVGELQDVPPRKDLPICLKYQNGFVTTFNFKDYTEDLSMDDEEPMNIGTLFEM